MYLSKEERKETIWACRYCPMCQIADRVAQLVRRESYTPRGRGAILFALDNNMLEWDDAVADIMYTTLNDGLLREWCVGNYDHEELVIDARAELFRRGLAPENVSRFIEDIHAGRRKGESPVEILDRAGVTMEAKANTLILAGYDATSTQKSSLIALGKLFQASGESFKCIADEPPSGWSLYQLGDWEGAKEYSVKLSESVKAAEVSRVVVLDSDLYRMLITRTARFGGNLEGVKVVHAITLLLEWLQSGRITVKSPIEEIVTYQDPSALARYCEVIEAPRELLSAILKNDLREMETSGKMAKSCGSEGMLEVHKPELAHKVSLMRLEEAKETGAAILATGCVRCDAVLLRAQESAGTRDIKVMNIVDLVARAAGIEV